MAVKTGGYYLDIYKGKTFVESKQGFSDKKDALMWLYKVKPSKAFLMKERTIIHDDGDWESDDKIVAEINRVKRKAGYVMVYQVFDPYLGDDYKWDISPKGTLVNKR